MRTPSTLVVCVGTIFFLLYLLPWHNLPSITVLTASPPIHASLRFDPVVTDEEEDYGEIPLFREPGPKTSTYQHQFNPGLMSTSSNLGLVPYRAIIHSGIKFNASQSDMLVLLHIQKTGGTSFEKHLVQDLDIQQPCICWKRKKRCKCPRPQIGDKVANTSKENSEPWLFSRFATGWVCGLHADWTELNTCVDEELNKAYGSQTKRRYFYMTMIRDPVHRFLSEFRHVQRGATWRASRHSCDGTFATALELGSCYDGRSWKGVKLSDFLSCPYNMGFNRQTRMLADLSLVGCYNRSAMPEAERNRILLASAKHNLESMAFVGLTEHQRISQYVFEETFGVRFKSPFTQNEDTYSKATMEEATPEQLELVRAANALDLELYSFAEQLLHSRFVELKNMDTNFEEHYNYLGEGNGRRFSWDEVDLEE